MTGEFEDDDVLGGDGKTRPSPAQTIKLRDYLKRHGRNHSLQAVVDEFKTRGFDISKAQVGRYLKGVEGGIAPLPKTKAPEQKAVRRNEARRMRRMGKSLGPNERQPEDSPIVKALAKEVISRRERFDAIMTENTSAALLAVKENRSRMALNILICEVMADKADLLVLDMRGTAALIDALTVGAKLSGGASLEVLRPSEVLPAEAGDPAGMKDITPAPKVVNELADELAAFRKRRNGTNGHGAG